MTDAPDGPDVRVPDSSAAARALVEGLAAAGVREAVLCPGSRSAPLAYALHAADAAGVVRLHVRVDERAAGFAALGMGKASGVPAAVVTTSGTAVANLVPAVLEAHHAGVPLLAVTADRPARLRGTWANQTSELQAGLFGGAVRAALDEEAGPDPGRWRELAVGAARAAVAGAGPVHVNVGFDEPLVPPGLAWRPAPAGGPRAPGAQPAAGEGDHTVLDAGPPTVVVAGDGAGPAARALAEAAGWPLLAEPTSGARSGPCRVPAYRLLLESALARRVRRAVVLGRPTLSRPVTRLLARDDVELVTLVPGDGRPAPVPGRAARVVAGPVVPSGRDDPEWPAAWLRAGALAAGAVDAVLAAEREATGALSGYDVAAAVVAATGAATGLVVAASNPVRDADLAAGEVGAAFALANRGLSGIDGIVSTAAGAALATGVPVRALVGDLAFLHDTGALLVGPGEPAPRLQVVVANDGGGGIFGLLEHGEDRFSGAFERVFGTPHRVDLAALCAAHGARHEVAADLPGLAAALARPPSAGASVVEVRVPRARERGLARRLAEAAIAATG